MTEQEFRNYLAAGIVCESLWPGVEPPPILAAKHTWYKGTVSILYITSITLMDMYMPTGAETESWAADVYDTGSIMCYLNGNDLIIAGNGSGKIRANENSSSCFASFRACSDIIGLELLDTASVNNMRDMFYGCVALRSVNVSHFNTRSVRDMYRMFYWLEIPTSLDLTSFDTSNVKDMRHIFGACENLVSISVSDKWVISDGCDTTNMFTGCGCSSVTYV